MKDTTVTTLVFDYLVKIDDFATAPTIAEAIKLNTELVRSALNFLRKCQAVTTTEADNRLWWGATPAYDTRKRTFEERAPVNGRVNKDRRHRDEK